MSRDAMSLLGTSTSTRSRARLWKPSRPIEGPPVNVIHSASTCPNAMHLIVPKPAYPHFHETAWTRNQPQQRQYLQLQAQSQPHTSLSLLSPRVATTTSIVKPSETGRAVHHASVLFRGHRLRTQGHLEYTLIIRLLIGGVCVPNAQVSV
ncbi:hypothetical protein L218DRAFT_489114 [Marasmius fiardii PR-910]|nr:hypothetical protein L218DRAFT_489114 [Marasmius fiardii PR-910]